MGRGLAKYTELSIWLADKLKVINHCPAWPAIGFHGYTNASLLCCRDRANTTHGE
jgi:hypothetical protein